MERVVCCFVIVYSTSNQVEADMFFRWLARRGGREVRDLEEEAAVGAQGEATRACGPEGDGEGRGLGGWIG
jgi:hypothetical protein